MKSLRILPTLKGRLTFWFTAICLVPLTLMTTFIYFERVKTARELIFSKLTAVSTLQQKGINTMLDSVARDVATLASGPAVVEAAHAMVREGAAGAPGGGEGPQQLFLGYQNNYDAVADVSIVATDGTILLSTAHQRVRGAIAQPVIVSSAIRDLAPIYGDVYLSKSDGAPSLDVAAPIRKGGRALPAAVVVRYNFRRLIADITENRAGMGQTGEIVLVNRDVMPLVDLRALPGGLLKVPLRGRPSILASQGQSGITQSLDYRGEEVLAAYAYVPRTGWGLVCKQDVHEIMAPIARLLYVTYGLAAIISLIVGAVALRLARDMSEPIARLSRAAERIGHGEYTARIAVEGLAEQKLLAVSFNAMADALELKLEAQNRLSCIADYLVTAEDIDHFFQSLLPLLMQVTGARMAAAFMEEDAGEFAPVCSIGADSRQLRRFNRTELEGELGVILQSRNVSYIAGSEGGTLRFVTAFGEIVPAEILTVPIFLGADIVAFGSLASEKPFAPVVHDTLEQAILPLSAAFSRVLAGRDVRRLAEELSAKNAELTQQSTELAHQSQELSRRNRVLGIQKQQLEEATRLKSEFLSNMSHELRTPLNSVLALSRVLAMQGAERFTEEERSYLAIIERNGRHLLELINDILDLAKIESGKHDALFEPLRLEEVADEIVQGLQPIASAKGIRLSLQRDENLPHVVTDGKKLRQILQNLVGNAVKFTPHGSVTVTLRSDGRHAYAEVEDTGIGIAAEHLDVIFQEFRQADGSTSRSFEGTGLGLAIAKKTAHLLGGEIMVASTPGEGSVFTLRLPLDGRAVTGEPPQRPASSGHRPAPASYPSKKTVLVVDDDPAAAGLIGSHLAQSGYDVATALNGPDALQLARAKKPFAITLDILMPGMDGWMVMSELKNHPDTADIPVIVVSISDDRETGFALGAIGVITKPVSREELLAEFDKLAVAGCKLVLVVDDEELDRLTIASILKESGMDVLLAANGQQALDLAVTGHPDVVTLDLVMPDMDGRLVLDKLRANPLTAEIPVVIITSKDLSMEEATRLSSGVTAILSKSGLDRSKILDDLLTSLGRLGLSLPEKPERRASRILIVEDSEAATIQLRFALESAGFSVDAVSGGRPALEYLQTHVPDGIILDLMMPEVDGFTVLQRVRASALTKDVPVLIMTAKTLSPGEHERLRGLDAANVVQKGDVDQQELLGRVYEMLGRVTVFRETEPVCEEVVALSVARQGSGAVLVIEDNPDNLACVRASLAGRFPLVEAVDGEEGLAAVESSSPSLILLDIQLPGMDGLALLQRLKNNPVTAAIPVVALTASAMSGERERLIAAGCIEYLSKPFQVDELVEVVQRYVPQLPGEAG